MTNSIFKKVYILTIILLMSSINISYAKVKLEGVEVSSPVADPKVNQSSDTIISRNPYTEHNPLTENLSGKAKEEYDSVNNYKIDLNTLGLRVKYFSPTYLNIRQSALSSYYMAYYVRGGNDTLVYDALSYTDEIHDLVTDYKDAYEGYERERASLDRSDPEYANKYRTLTVEIETYKYMYRTAKATYDTTNKTINATKTSLGLGKALYNIGNVDNNGQVTFARDAITKSLSSAVLSYLQLKTYVDILENQTNLYYDMYKLNEKNLGLGLATSNDVLSSFSTYENAKDMIKKTKSTMKSVKEQIANTLGYNISDIDKLEFVEPEIDFTYLGSIDFNKDKERAYTSNSTYYNISISASDRERPGSTGEALLASRQNYASSKVIAEFDDVYNKLQAALLGFEASTYLNQALELNKAGAVRKLQNNLVSELEYKGLQLQNLSDELQVKIAKYNLINAYNDYYYATLGHLDIS